MTSVPTTPSLIQLIDPYERNLMGLARRLFLMEAFQTDLDRVTRLKTFRFRNELIWLLMLDTRDMLVMHLASWFDGALGRGGLIRQLQVHYVSDLPPLPRPMAPNPTPNPDEPEWAERHDQEERTRWHSESFNRLFPNAKSHPNGADFDGLRQSFKAHAQPLKDDRNWNRAHPYEKVSGTATMSKLPELRSHLTYAEQFMNDIREVGGHGKMAYHEMNWTSASYVAPDLVDAMLIGDPERLRRLRGTSSRDELYDRLHAEHEARDAKKDDFFNDVHMPPP
jgi:hypothetical protein